MRTEGTHCLYDLDFAKLVAEAAPRSNTADLKTKARAKGKAAGQKVPAMGAPAQSQLIEKLKELMTNRNKAGSTSAADLAAGVKAAEANSDEAEDAGQEE